MSIILPNPMEGIGQGIRSAGSALGGALQRLGDERKEKGILESVVGNLDYDDPESIKAAITNPNFARLPEPMQKLIGNKYAEIEKNNTFKRASKAASEKGGFFTEEGQNAFIEEYGKAGGNPLEALKYLPKKQDAKPKPQTAYQKDLDKEKAKVVIDYMRGGDKRDNRLKDTLDYLEQEAENVGFAKSLATGDYLLPGEKYTQYENMGNLMLDQVIKVFNPAGVLPQSKLKWIRDQFAISPYDRQEVIKGKIAALRSLIDKGMKDYDKIGELIAEYGDDIPTKEFMKAVSGLENTIDNAISNEGKTKDEKTVNKLPTKAKKGTIATDTKSGKRYVYDGKRWKLESN